MTSAEQARLSFPNNGMEEDRGKHFKLLEDTRLEGTALQFDRHYCAGCYGAVHSVLFLCPYCDTHLTVPKVADQSFDCPVEDLVTHEYTGVPEADAAPAQAGGGDLAAGGAPDL
eukprot:7118789-Alexandrium_andersonii.AAC.1